MSSDTVPTKGSRWALVADGCLMTAAAFSLLTLPGLVFVALGWMRTGPDGPADTLSVVLSLIVSVLTLLTVVVGPASAWLLHRRRVTAMAVVGAILGAGAAMVVVLGVSTVAAMTGPKSDTFALADLAGVFTVVGALALAAAVAIVAVEVDAIRDLVASPRRHERLDIARIAAVAVILLFAGVALWLGVVRPELGMGEAGIFALVAGIFGAIVVGVTELVTTLSGRRTGGREVPADA
jgi:drug/metabolite transporter (DMT)-like permease